VGAVEKARKLADDSRARPTPVAALLDHVRLALLLMFVRVAEVDKALDHERFEQLGGAICGQAALVEFEPVSDEMITERPEKSTRFPSRFWQTTLLSPLSMSPGDSGGRGCLYH
jgi:hypothetical protein